MSKDQGINIILYPRSYNKRGEESLHSVVGLTCDGREVNIKLRLDPKSSSSKNAPSIAEFSRIDRKARQACIATETNGPDAREGILLFTQASLEGTNKRNLETYTARWACVLCSDSDSPDPLSGVGRMEINRHSQPIRQLKDQLAIARSKDNAEEIEALGRQLGDPQNFAYPVILYRHKQMIEHAAVNKYSFKCSLLEALAPLTPLGLTVGFMIRAMNADGRIIEGSYKEFFSRYISSEARQQSAEETVDMFLALHGAQYFCDELTRLECIPLVKINCGVRGNAYYGARKQFEAINRLYYSEDEPQVCNVVARITHYEDGNTSILSRLFNTSAPLGHPARLDRLGRPSKLFEYEGVKLAYKDSSEGDLVERPIGLNQASTISRADWILMNDRPPVLPAPSSDREQADEDAQMIEHSSGDLDDLTEQVQHEDAPSDASIPPAHSVRDEPLKEDRPDTKAQRNDGAPADERLVPERRGPDADLSALGRSPGAPTVFDDVPSNIPVKGSGSERLTGMAAYLRKRR